jgi:hypothetical protein
MSIQHAKKTFLKLVCFSLADGYVSQFLADAKNKTKQNKTKQTNKQTKNKKKKWPK